ncbi:MULTISPECIES: hypothetical protein [Thermoactinomyces]|uniref:Uncharacterized protein n=1 Tax=Thermoactinomyces daqus TaxID=1329516 RepID=A0A7W1X9W9_9BACL|nr:MULTISPECIES: hypothetical protein [Thermoactinomyces]MBA4542705.1 hypothetical protein [Thermoactinomyces daqus]MBH8607275.1 hypothetical protein [Thermoactinomyces sp. CICC 10521]
MRTIGIYLFLLVTSLLFIVGIDLAIGFPLGESIEKMFFPFEMMDYMAIFLTVSFLVYPLVRNLIWWGMNLVR